MTSAIAVGADLALLPEAGKPEAATIEQIVDTALTVRRRARRTRRVILLEVEGVSIPIDRRKTSVDARLRARPTPTPPGSRPG